MSSLQGTDRPAQADSSRARKVSAMADAVSDAVWISGGVLAFFLKALNPKHSQIHSVTGRASGNSFPEQDTSLVLVLSTV